MMTELFGALPCAWSRIELPYLTRIPDCSPPQRHSLTDLYLNEGRQAKLERLASAAEAQRAAECTFRPVINPRSASLGRQRRGSLVLASADVHEQANKLRSSILTVGAHTATGHGLHGVAAGGRGTHSFDGQFA